MNRPLTRERFRLLADERAADAEVLLNADRWSAAYYLTGYAVECGLKACVLRRVTDEGGAMLFSDRSFQRTACLSHDFLQLLHGAGLRDARRERAAEPGSRFDAYWRFALLWSVTSRYRGASPLEARVLYDAVTHPIDGILPWIRQHW